ncbi:uncharacterized protein BDZ83DRAFT_618305 [Colletotrichum acutatum]|uniref:Uncharacterized protein n=1 Tax=Glomerella acutata TaxID=27357 RepID=A0AAD8XFC5_GLOAC|nr:uncharacterized protein BDZ83DRAFT_618305 [Colletotrichum acutatum]KAK1725759.1 hypothetical protein BDZ83DRAFT_618305 [Colletotrichum acutatum]
MQWKTGSLSIGFLHLPPCSSVLCHSVLLCSVLRFALSFSSAHPRYSLPIFLTSPSVLRLSHTYLVDLSIPVSLFHVIIELRLSRPNKVPDRWTVLFLCFYLTISYTLFTHTHTHTLSLSLSLSIPRSPQFPPSS